MKLWCGCILSVFILTSGSAQERITWFFDDFRNLELGSRWHPTSGAWKLVGGILTCDTKQDQLLSSSYYIYGKKPFTIEVALRGNRAGVYFSLDDTISDALSHLVRFDGKKLNTGYLNGAGTYIVTGTRETERTLTDWTLLRIELDPLNRRYDVYVNERRALTDTTMRFTSGWIGLGASEELTEFKSIRVSGDEYQGKLDGFGKGEKVSFRHVKYLRTTQQGMEVYDPERDRLQEIDQFGNVIHSRRAKHQPLPVITVKTQQHIFTIDGNRILVKNLSGATVDSITEGLHTPSALLADTSSVYVADKGAGAIFRFDVDRQLIGTYTAESIGGFIAPQAMDFLSEKKDYYRRGDIVVTDYDRIIFVPRSLEERTPVVDPTSPTGVTVSWEKWPMSQWEIPTTNFAPNPNKPEPAKGRIRYAEEDGEWNEVEAEMNGTWRINHAVLTNLKPATRYSYKVSTPVRMIPQTTEFSREYHFTTQSRDSTRTK
ncbi:MAG: fibronectin type III domain-containing protein [Bacteroidota bacterium]